MPVHLIATIEFMVQLNDDYDDDNDDDDEEEERMVVCEATQQGLLCWSSDLVT